MAKKIGGILLVVVVLVAAIGGVLIFKHQQDVKAAHVRQEKIYQALQKKEQLAFKTAYDSGKASDIARAESLIDKLHKQDKVGAEKKVQVLKADLADIASARTAVAQAQKLQNDDSVAAAQTQVNQLTTPYESKDKAALQATLSAVKQKVAAAQAAAEKAKKLAAAKALAAKKAEEAKAAAEKLAAQKAAQAKAAAATTNNVSSASPVPAGKKLIALTFDDGPNPATTPTLLATLQRENVHVTFFALGQEAQANPSIIKQEAAMGNEVASHTWDHADLTTLSPAAQTQEIMSAHNLINQLTGQNVMLFRPPYGSYSKTTLSLTNLTAVCWSVDTNDWRYVNNTQAVVNNALSGAHDGAIILIHDIHYWSVAAVPQIIDSLKAQGYTFVTVSQLLQARDGGAKAQQVYFGQ